MNKKRSNPSIYNVSFQDLLDLWVETMWPDDNVLVVWDAVTHLDLLKSIGFNLDQSALYNNKMLTIVLDDIMDCFRIMDTISAHEDHPFTQVYRDGKLLTDNLENLRPDITI